MIATSKVVCQGPLISIGSICSQPAGFVDEPRVVQSQVAQSLSQP